MGNEQQTEPGSWSSGELGDEKKLVNMSIPDLISELRVATLTKQFDQVEHVLVAREAQLKSEADKMRQILELERVEKMEIDDQLKKCRELCQKRKRGEELYEKLLANVKKNGLEDTTVEELRAKNGKLEGELKMYKEKFAEFNARVSKMEHETQMLMNERKNEGDFGADHGFTFLKVKEERETDEIHVHGGDSVNKNADSNVSRRNGYTSAGIGQSSKNPNKDVSASGRWASGNYIMIEDSDADDNDNDNDNDKKEGTCQFVTDNGHPNSSSAVTSQQKSDSTKEDVIEMLKRKYRL